MSNSPSLTNAKHDPKGGKTPKLGGQGQQPQTQQQARSKLHASAGSKNYPTGNEIQQPLLQLGFRVNDKSIGTGSYAKVKKCIREADGKEFAVKIIDRDKAPVDFVSKFLPRELDIIRKLDHPNIVKVAHILEAKSLTFIVMEYASNGDLLDYINRTVRLQESVAKRMFRELCDAIYYIHFRNICHRDLKCENLLLDNHLHIKLADFGFARYCVDPSPNDNRKNGAEKKILSRTFCGSPAYAAPEILRSQEYNPKLYDIWSLGCILYIMIYSKMPYDDSDIKKMVEAQTSKGGLHFGSEGSPEVQDLISRMLQVEVTQRWPIELVQKHPWFGRQMQVNNQASSISYITTTNRGQEQGASHPMQKRPGLPVYA